MATKFSAANPKNSKRRVAGCRLSMQFVLALERKTNSSSVMEAHTHSGMVAKSSAYANLRRRGAYWCADIYITYACMRVCVCVIVVMVCALCPTGVGVSVRRLSLPYEYP